MERVDLPKPVHEIPSIEEFNGLDDNEVLLSEFDFDSSDEDLNHMMAVLLGLFYEFYESCQYLGDDYFKSSGFINDLNALNTSLKENWRLLLKDYISSKHDYYDTHWLLPPDTVKSSEVNTLSLINTGVNAVTDTLKQDLKDKSTYYQIMENTSGKFLPHANFRRAMKKLKTQIDFKTQAINKQIKRDYDKFVYGEEALFDWVCSGRNTCAWCYMVEAESPLPLNMLPVDHPNGECRIEPHNPGQYSDEYNKVRFFK